MDFPMVSFCSDNKRGFNRVLSNWYKKGTNTTMLDKGSVVHLDPPTESHYIHYNKSSKFHNFLKSCNPSSFQPNSKFSPAHQFVSLSIVGGFLGSKSQSRSGNIHDNCIWDFMKFAENLFESSGISPLIHEGLSGQSVSSPPKKKFAEEALVEENLRTAIGSHPPLTTEGSKQSYAEVAKACALRPIKLEDSLQKASVVSKEDSTQVNNNTKRRSKPSQSRSGRRKHHRRENTSPSLEKAKDFRTFQPKNCVSQPNTSKSFNRPSKISNSSSRRVQREAVAAQGGGSSGRSHCRSKYRSFSERKAGGPRKYNCDIEMVNWRTGEPLGDTSVPEDAEEMLGTGRLVNKSGGQKMDGEYDSAVDCVNGCDREQMQCDRTSPGVLSLCELQNPAKLRRRSFSSECSLDSEDSFIIFQSDTNSDSLSDVSGDWSDSASDDSCDSDIDPRMEFEFCVGQSPTSQRLQEVNDRWKRACEENSSMPTQNDSASGMGSNQVKKVHFSPFNPTIHWMVAWNYAYRDSRVGPWEVMARDRARFQSRVQQLENILAPIFRQEHRAKIWEKLHA